MEIKQLHELVNTALTETLGEEAILNEDLSNLTTLGEKVLSSNNMLDAYVKTIINKVGKTIIVAREYKGFAPNILTEKWEYGSVLEKIRGGLLDVTENNTWELQDGESYDVNIFYKPIVSATFYNSLTTIECPISITYRQVKQSFIDGEKLNAFISMIYMSVENTLTIALDNMTMRSLNSFIAEKCEKNNGIINLLSLYNSSYNKNLTPENAIIDKDFIKFANYTMSLYISRLNTMSTLFNTEGNEVFTSKNYLKFVLIDNLDKASKMYLESDTYHKDLVSLKGFSTVPYWQGSGEDFSFRNCSTIDVTTHSGKKVKAEYIIGMMFDKYAIMMANLDRRTTTNYNARGEFWNNYNKQDVGYYIDLGENGVIFTLSDAEVTD